MSTIVLQHIAVYDIRFQYLQEFFRVLQAGRAALVPDGLRRGLRQGRLLRQPLPRGEHELVPRHDGHEPGADRRDLEKIGFVDFSYAIRPSFDDGHPFWIFAKAYRPSLAATLGLAA